MFPHPHRNTRSESPCANAAFHLAHRCACLPFAHRDITRPNWKRQQSLIEIVSADLPFSAILTAAQFFEGQGSPCVHLALFVGHRLFSRGCRSLQTLRKVNRAQDVDSIPSGVPEITTDFLPLRLACVTCRVDRDTSRNSTGPQVRELPQSRPTSNLGTVLASA